MNALIRLLDTDVVTQAVLTWLGQALLLGTAVALLTWVVTHVTRRRMRPALEVALWALVLVRFVVPEGPGWSLSLASLWQRAAVGSAAATESVELNELGGMSGMEVVTDEEMAAAGTAGAGSWHWTTLVTGAYLACVLAVLAVQVRRYRVFRRRCTRLAAVDDAVRQLVAGVCRRLGVRRVPDTRLDETDTSPFVLGFLHPMLILSRRQLAQLDELETVIVHEIAHLRRGDLIVRCLQCLAGALLFFWPVVAWVNRQLDAAREHACDEWALRHGKLTPGEYARCLLNALPRRHVQPVLCPHSCMAGRVSHFERRIDVILETDGRARRRPVLGLVAGLALAGWAVFVLAGAAAAPAAEKSGDDLGAEVLAQLAGLTKVPGLDQDGDGQVTMEEGYPLLLAIALRMPANLLMESHDDVDADGSGQLSIREVYIWIRGFRLLDEARKRAELAVQAAAAAGTTVDADGVKQAERAAYETVLRRRMWLLRSAKSTSLEDGTLARLARRIREIDAALATEGGGRKVVKAAAVEAQPEVLRAKAAELTGEAEKLLQQAAALAAQAQKASGQSADELLKDAGVMRKTAAQLELKAKELLRLADEARE